MSVWMTDNDRNCCAWLRELVKAGELEGEVCERDIKELKPEDCTATQQHFFCGIGGWPYALRLAGWPGELPVWTGSCPCQPLSCAGKRKGHADERHLWPVWFNLIRQCRPGTIFGEQVASRDGLEWLDGVFADLEGEGYACAAADLCAAGVGAPHIRQRLYWVAHAEQRPAERQRLDLGSQTGSHEGEARQRQRVRLDVGDGGIADGLGDAATGRWSRQNGTGKQEQGPGSGCDTGWSRYRLIECRDGRTRRIPVEPEFFPLAHGFPGRVGLLRGYGNAIVPQVAAQFVRACMSILLQRG